MITIYILFSQVSPCKNVFSNGFGLYEIARRNILLTISISQCKCDRARERKNVSIDMNYTRGSMPL